MFCQKVLILFVTISITQASETKRQLKCKVYPNNGDEFNVVHVTASSNEDTIHYLWSSYVLPSVIVSRTSKDTDLMINFEKLRLFQEGAITFTKQPLASTGFTVSQLWQNIYNSDTAEIDEVNKVLPLNIESLNWKNITDSSISCSDNFVSLNFVSSSDEEVFSQGGSFELQFSIASMEESASDYPHLIYSGNSTQIKAVFNDFYSNFSRVRYAMEMSIFSPMLEKCSSNDCEMIVTKSVSDEFSPGIFSDISLSPPCSEDSFLSWRPVAYISSTPTVANSTDAKITSKCPMSSISGSKSIAELFFRDQLKYTICAFNMTFGTKGDGFYPKTKFTMWSLMAGVGSTVGFKLSATALIFFSVGMGALLLFILSGLIFLGVQKCLKKEELLLAENIIN